MSVDFRDIWDFQDPVASEHRFRSLLVDTGAPENRLEIQTQVARALGLQGAFDRAHRLLDEVKEGLTDDTPVARVRYLLERGRVYNSRGEFMTARLLFETAWDLARAIGNDDLAVDAAHMVAIAAPAEEKERWNLRALALAEESDDPAAKRWLGSLYNNMGWDAHDAGDYAEALDLLEKAWAWHKERNAGWGERVAKWSVAKQLRFLDRRDEALKMQEELLEQYRRDEPGGEGFVHEEIGELLLAAGDVEAARPHFARAHELLSSIEWVEPARLQRMKELGS